MPDFGWALLFIVVGGLLSLVGVLINQVMENRREASRERLRTKENLRRDVLKAYIEESITALQKDLACGFDAVDQIRKLFTRVCLMGELQLQEQEAMLAEIRSIDFKSDPCAKTIGIARVSDFGDKFEAWVMYGYRSIESYINVAHITASQMQELLKANKKLTEEEWKESAGRLFPDGKVWKLTKGTVIDVIMDLDTLGTTALLFHYTSHLDPVVKFADDPMIESIRESIEPKVDKYMKKEAEALGMKPDEWGAKHLDAEDKKND